MTTNRSKRVSPIHSARDFVRLVLTLQPAAALLSLLMTLAVGFLGGCGILLLLPLLESIGTGQVADGHRASNRLAIAFEWIGLEPGLEAVLVLFLVVVGGQTLLRRQSTLINARLQLDLGHTLQNRLFQSVVRSRWGFFANTRKSDFIHAMTHDLNRVSQGAMTLLSLCSSCVLVAVHLGVSFLISPWLTLTVLAATGLLTPILLWLNRLASDTGSKLTSRSKDYYHRIEQQLAGMKEIKSLGGEERQVEQFRDLTAEVKSTQFRFRQATANSAVVFSFGSALLLGGLLLTAVNVFAVPAIELLVLVVVFSRLAPQLRQVQQQYQQFLHTLAALESFTTLQTRCDAERENFHHGVPEAAHGELKVFTPKDTSAEIELRNIGFRYDPQSTTSALQDVNLKIPSNQTTALVGPSGAGKSTLADLLLGLLSPTDGSIVVDGKPLEEKDLAIWRNRIGYVPQETFLLNDTIRANLELAKPNATDAELLSALEAAAADGFVLQPSRGLDCMIGDRGVRLSGGERQRIALARALLRRPAVLILDEATSSLDAENQNRIQQAIEKMHGQLTIITIAHRLSTIRHADQIVVLERGRVVETGSYDQLINRPDSTFQSLAHADAGVVANSYSA
jgi:ATP-binding cassette subfamily C protein